MLKGRIRNSAIEEISPEKSRVRDTCPGRYVTESVLVIIVDIRTGSLC